MKSHLKLIYVLVFIFIFLSCKSDDYEELPPDNGNIINLPSNPQRTGSASKGYEYLTTGNYMSSGIPYDAYIAVFGTNSPNLLNRTGDNAVIPFEYNTVTAPNGVKIVAPNCMQCHSGKINNQYIVGLGNNDYDFTENREQLITILNAGLTTLYGQNSKEWEAYDQFRKTITAIGSKTMTETRGSNPADKITRILSTYRDKNTLEWQDQPAIETNSTVVPSDVPAWWLLKKKNAMFYHGIGREDFVKYIMALSLVTLKDVDKANEVDKNMEDVLAYIYSLESPKYPFDIDEDLAQNGKTVFENNCSKCHGTYGNNESYPNLLVPLSIVKTDAALSNQYTQESEINTYFFNWFNTGWFGSGADGLNVLAEGGYVAQPLDGIWATAPYFHNGSVPTLENVLNSSSRPTYWSRSFDSADYDKTKVGWNYTTEASKVDKNTYDTSLFGYGNSGHAFGDKLSNEERKAVIEYLKTL